MLNRKPIGANQKATERWEATNRMTIQIFLSFWQKVGLDLEFPEMQAGDAASYTEWKDKSGYKCQGMRKPGGGQKHGIVRTIGDDFIREETYYQDELHGLTFYWFDDNYTAFEAIIFDHGEMKAKIYWKDDWSEYGSDGDKELILENNGLSIFKP